MRGIPAVLLGCALAAGSVNGAVVSSWEDGTLGGWTVPSGTGSNPSASTGATNGTHSLQIDIPAAANSWSLTQIQHSAFASGTGLDVPAGRTLISFDVTTNAANVWACQLIQGGNPAYNSGVVGATDCSSPNGSWKTTHISYDFLSVYPNPAPVGWENFRMIFRGDNSGNPSVARTVYIDNYSIGAVPEPGSIAVLGVSALGLVRRRRA